MLYFYNKSIMFMIAPNSGRYYASLIVIPGVCRGVVTLLELRKKNRQMNNLILIKLLLYLLKATLKPLGLS